MPLCSRCQHRIDAAAIQCPHCGLVLKAHGHPGIPLHQAADQGFLCDTCTYHGDNTCTFPQRPYAKTCTLYQSIHQPLEAERGRARSPRPSMNSLWRQHGVWLTLAALIAISLAIAIS